MDQPEKPTEDLIVDMITQELRVFTNPESTPENMESSLCKLSCLTALLQGMGFINPSGVINRLAGLITLVPLQVLEQKRDSLPSL